MLLPIPKWLSQLAIPKNSSEEDMIKKLRAENPGYTIKHVQMKNRFTGRVRATSGFKTFQGKPSEIDVALKNQRLIEMAGRGEIDLADIDFSTGEIKAGEVELPDTSWAYEDR